MNTLGALRRSSSQERAMSDARRKLGSLDRELKIQVNKLESKLAQAKRKPKGRTGLLELDEIKKDYLLQIQLSSNPQNLKKDKEKYDKLQSLENNYVKNQREVSIVIFQTKQLKEDIKSIRKQCEEINLIVRRGSPNQPSLHLLLHQISKLEDRLHKETTDKDLTLKRNSSHKYQINELLKVRRNHHEHSISLHGKIASARRKIAELTDEANEAIDSCFAGIAQTSFLRNQHDKQNGEYRIALWEFEMKMHYDAGMYGFYATKIGERPLLEKEADRLIRLKKEESQMVEFRYQKAKHDLQGLRHFIKAGEDVPAIIPRFNQLEQQNFALFQYVTQKNEEIVNVEREIAEMKETIESDLDNRDKEMGELKKGLEQVDATIAYQEEVYKDSLSMGPLFKDSSEVLGECITNILLLTSAVGQNPLLSYLGHHQDRVDSKAIELTFSLLEHSVADLLYQRSCLEIQKAFEIDRVHLPISQGLGHEGKPISHGGPYEPKIKIASHHQSVELDEVNAGLIPAEKPVPYMELKESLVEEFRQEDGSNNPSQHITEH